MGVATKGGLVILKGGAVAGSCNCCGGWYCVSQCKNITPSQYTASDFSDACWSVSGGTRNPPVLSGRASRCAEIPRTGNVTINITASLARPTSFAGGGLGGNVGVVGVCISRDTLLSASASSLYQIFDTSGNPSNSAYDTSVLYSRQELLGFARRPFSGAVSGTFSRRDEKWYISSPEVAEQEMPPPFGNQDFFYHGILVTNTVAQFTSYSISVS